MDNKYVSLDIKKRTPDQRGNDISIFLYIMFFNEDKAIDKIKEATRHNPDQAFYDMKLFLLGQRELRDTQVIVNGKPEEYWMQKSMRIIFDNWNRYKNLKILKEIADYCNDGLSRKVPGQNKKRFAFIREYYKNGSSKCSMNVYKLLYDITDPSRADTSSPNPNFDDANAVEEFLTFTERLEKESGVDEYQLD